jgi:hypothetical protein
VYCKSEEDAKSEYQHLKEGIHMMKKQDEGTAGKRKPTMEQGSAATWPFTTEIRGGKRPLRHT